MRIVTGAALAMLATGCIPKGRYLEEIEGYQSRLRDRAAALERCQDEGRTLRRELAETKELLDGSTRQLAYQIAETGALQEDVERMRQALQELESRQARARIILASFQDLVSRFQSLIDAGTLQVKVVDGRMTVQLATDILFAPGSATLSTEGREALLEVAAILASIPDREFQVAGHTDDVPIATSRFPSNWHLGSARAIAVTDVLAEGGLDASRVSASSYAAFQPACSNETPEGRACNRRIEIIIVPDLSGLPGYDELQQLGADAERVTQ